MRCHLRTYVYYVAIVCVCTMCVCVCVCVCAGIRVVSNAGGVNPHACVTALLETARDQGVELSVATVTGDNFIDKVCTYVYTCNTCVNARNGTLHTLYSVYRGHP